MYCPYCGKENEDSANFCKTCGRDISVNDAAIKKNKKRRIIVIALIAGLAALLVLTGITGMRYMKASKWQEYYDLGTKYLTEENYEEAVVAFTNAIEIDEKKPQAYTGRGDAYTGSAEKAAEAEKLTEAVDLYEKAADDYETAVELEDSDAESKLQEVKDAAGQLEIQIQEAESEAKAMEYFEEHRAEAENLIMHIQSSAYFDSEAAGTSDSAAFGALYLFIIGPFGYAWLCDENYNFTDNADGIVDEYHISIEDKPDPLRLMSYIYDVFDADKCDWILKNIFNIEPDRTLEPIESTSSEGAAMYYHNGKYYVDTYATDAVFAEELNITDVQSLGDDTFLIEYDAVAIDERYSGQAKLKGKMIDGKFYWSLLSFSSSY